MSVPTSSSARNSTSRSTAGRIADRATELVLLLISAIFLVLHALHLDADFPNHSPWMDWSKYTDEGWYGDAAIRHFQRGHWYVPGDFNPGIALPVWPILESAVFHFTGVNLIAARALTVGIFAPHPSLLVASPPPLAKHLPGARGQTHLPGPCDCRPAARRQPLLLCLHPHGHPGAHAHPPHSGRSPGRLLRHPGAGKRGHSAAASGSCAPLPSSLSACSLPLMVLTKTTAIFLLPSIAWLLWARAGYSLRPFLRLALPAATLAAVVWLGYFGFIVHPHFLSDYQYLFTANGYTGITAATAALDHRRQPSPTDCGWAASSTRLRSSRRVSFSSSIPVFSATLSSRRSCSGPSATPPSWPITRTFNLATTSL